MTQALREKMKTTRRSVQIEITKENDEAFCEAIGLCRKECIEALHTSEKDHQAKRTTKRKSLCEIMS